jgi:hypothetical protein
MVKTNPAERRNGFNSATAEFVGFGNGSGPGRRCFWNPESAWEWGWNAGWRSAVERSKVQAEA